MNRPWIALTNVYLRRVAMFGVPGMILALVLPWLFARMVGLSADWSVSEQNPLGLYMNFVCIACCLTGLGAWAPLPDFMRGVAVRTLPLSNLSFSTFLWLIPGCVVAVGSLVLLYGCQVVYGVGWPILTTVVCITAFCMLCMSLGFWIRDFRVHRLLLALAVITAWIVWFTGQFYPAGYRQPLVPWTQFSVADLAVIACTLAASWKLQLTAWSRIRCGDTRIPLLFTMGDSEVDAIFNRQDLPVPNAVATPFAGLLAMEWRRGRPIALVGGIILAVFGIYMGSMIFIEGNARRGIIGLVPMVLGLAGFIMGIMVAQDWLWAPKRHGVRAFIGALPFSDKDLSRTLLWTLARGLTVIIPVSLSGLLIPRIVFSVFVGPVEFSAISIRMEAIGPAGVLTVVAALIAIAWVIGGFAATVCAAGSLWIVAASYAIGCGIPCAVLSLAQFGGSTGELIATALQWIVGIAVLVATIACFVRARQQELIASRTVAICCAVGAALTLAIGATLTDELLLQFMGLCFAALAVVSFAALPLAVSWNRHR